MASISYYYQYCTVHSSGILLLSVVSYYWFCKLFESRHLWFRDDFPQHVDTWLREKDLDLCRAEEETRVSVVCVVVTCQLVMVFGRLCVRSEGVGVRGVRG